MIIGGIGIPELSLNFTGKVFSSPVAREDLVHLALLSGEIGKGRFSKFRTQF